MVDASNFKQRGSIEVVCGSMFSGKTEELIRRIKRAKIAKLNVRIFKPRIDTRYDKVKVVSHDDNFIDSFPVDSSKEILKWCSDFDVIGIDEAQFFDGDLGKVCNSLANKGKRVILAGLDMDFRGKPFEPMMEVMAIAESVSKVRAICMQCGQDATYSFKFSATGGRVQLGEKDLYEPRCRTCYKEGMKNQKRKASKGSK